MNKEPEALLPTRGPLSVDPSRRCTAHLTDGSGQQCRKAAIKGSTVCASHGGRAPQVKKSALIRLNELVEPAITVLDDCIRKMRKSRSPDDARVALRAAMTVLDRCGYPASSKLTIEDPREAKAALAEVFGMTVEEIELWEQEPCPLDFLSLEAKQQIIAVIEMDKIRSTTPGLIESCYGSIFKGGKEAILQELIAAGIETGIKQLTTGDASELSEVSTLSEVSG